MLTHHRHDILLSQFGSAHPEILTNNHHCKITESHFLTGIDCNSKYIFITMHNAKLAMKLHFIKRYYEENDLNSILKDYANIIDTSAIQTLDIFTQQDCKTLFDLIDNAPNTNATLHNIPAEQHNILHLAFEDLLSGNVDVIAKLEQFTGFNANESTYINLTRYARTQHTPKSFISILP
jgi:hypothetical protein